MTTHDQDALRDPVCGMLVQPDSPFQATYKGKNYVFCSPRCLEVFQDHPERYVESSDEKPEKVEKAEAPPAAEGEEAPEHYLTCPMHPDVKEPVPRCPKCGMFLRPPTETPEKAPAAEEKAPAPAGAVYTCPMDPEVRQEEPGTCPKCGMALERSEPEALPTRTEYTCPMHPEVVQDSPGSCPVVKH